MVISGHVILVGSWCNYWLLVIACTVTIKAFLALIHTIQYETAVVNKVRYKKWRVFGYYFFSKNYCVPTIVGTIELAIYPILISLGSWESIAAWIGLKTAAGWRWQKNEDRQGYTNFLLGNALVIGAAFLLVLMIKTITVN
jgi:hypothetical protein